MRRNRRSTRSWAQRHLCPAGQPWLFLFTLHGSEEHRKLKDKARGRKRESRGRPQPGGMGVDHMTSLPSDWPSLEILTVHWSPVREKAGIVGERPPGESSWECLSRRTRRGVSRRAPREFPAPKPGGGNWERLGDCGRCESWGAGQATRPAWLRGRAQGSGRPGPEPRGRGRRGRAPQGGAGEKPGAPHPLPAPPPLISAQARLLGPSAELWPGPRSRLPSPTERPW